jgi:formamidopyrimidine-DNA glycosylase
MPELPEVEAVARDLRTALRDAVITAVHVDRWGVIEGAARSGDRLLLGGGVVDVLRHGKQLAVIGRDACVLVVQLGMTGEFGVVPARDPLVPHTHVRWSIAGGRELRFVDARRFGGLTLLRDQASLEARWSALGPDALALPDDWSDSLSTRRAPIKAAMLDQRIIAGVGNIYADESLACAGIRPGRACRRIRAGEYARLRAQLAAILRVAIDQGGSTVRTYKRLGGGAGGFQGSLRVYGRAGEPCRECGASLRHGLIASRTTVWCARCQS